MLNRVTENDCLEAINYLHANGYVEEMSRDQKYYTEILLKRVANTLSIKLEL